MKKTILLICTCLCVYLLSAQEKIVNDSRAQLRDVGSFHGIHVATGIQLYLTQGIEEKVAVSADTKESRDRIISEVEDGVLHIYFDYKKDLFSSDQKNRNLRAYVSCKMIDQLEASSGAQVELEGTVHSTDMKMVFSSGAACKGAISVKQVQISQSSGAQTVFSGEAENIIARASSGSQIDATELVAAEGDAHASSGGRISLRISKSLVASAHSGGDISYASDDAQHPSITINTSSGGQVSRK
jgi:hypothetical protein